MNNFEKLKFLFVTVGENTNRLGSVFNTVRGWQVIKPAKGEGELRLKNDYEYFLSLYYEKYIKDR